MGKLPKDKLDQDIAELDRIFESMAKLKSAPAQIRVDTLNRIMAKYLQRRGMLPDHLKKLLDN